LPLRCENADFRFLSKNNTGTLLLRSNPAGNNQKNIQTPYYRNYSRSALFNLPKLFMVIEEAQSILKSDNHFSIRRIVSYMVHGKIRGK